MSDITKAPGVGRVRPLAVLVSNWITRFTLGEVVRPIDAQAAEYATVMGDDALRRQFIGSSRSRRTLERLIGRTF